MNQNFDLFWTGVVVVIITNLLFSISENATKPEAVKTDDSECEISLVLQVCGIVIFSVIVTVRYIHIFALIIITWIFAQLATHGQTAKSSICSLRILINS